MAAATAIIYYTAASLLILLLIRKLAQICAKLIAGRCKCNVYLGGKTALITGGNSGLGYRTALALAGRGCRVILADRNNCEKSKEEIIKTTGNPNIVTKQFNLASLSSIRQLAKDICETEGRLDILINNAGAGGLGNSHTEDGLHIGMQVNYFGHFLLTHLLSGLLKKSSPSRVVFVTSYLAFCNNLTFDNLNYPENVPASFWSELAVYSNAKLCQIIAAKEMAKKLHKTGVTVNAVHPGIVNTPIYLNYAKKLSVGWLVQCLFDEMVLKCFSKSAEEGAQTVIHAALAAELDGVSGKFLCDCRIAGEPSAKLEDPFFMRKIWEMSEEYVKLAADELL